MRTLRRPDFQLAPDPAAFRAARVAAGLTVADVAVLTGRKLHSVYDLENGWNSPSLPLVLRLAVLYGVSVDSLLKRIPDDGLSPAGPRHVQREIPALLRVP